MNDAVAALLAGELVILPTDTVYGLCALADGPEPTERLYELKRRDPLQPRHCSCTTSTCYSNACRSSAGAPP